ncbi:MAG: S4 domain-containing protein [Verrucomicrobiota bacterium]
MSESVRADKWLWATRFFKTRGLAAEKCLDGKVRRNGHLLKPSSPVQPGDLLEIPFPEGPGVRRVAVKEVIVKRVGAPQAQACYEDRTPAEVYEAQKEWHLARLEAPKGRPTKKDRRDLDRIHGFWDREPE